MANILEFSWIRSCPYQALFARSLGFAPDSSLGDLDQNFMRIVKP